MMSDGGDVELELDIRMHLMMSIVARDSMEGGCGLLGSMEHVEEESSTDTWMSYNIPN